MNDRSAPKRTRRMMIASGLYVVLGHASAMGHQFWIEPSAFLMKEGSPVRVRLQVGEHFAGVPVERKSERIVRFSLIGPNDEKPIEGVEGRDPAGFFAAPPAGAYTIAYQSNHAFIELDAEKFTAYLKEEGLTSIIKSRAERGQSDKAAREAYARCAKALVRVTPRSESAPSALAFQGAFDRPAGLPLELIAENDPYSLKAGERITIRLMLEGNPLSDAQLVAVSKKHTSDEKTMRTDMNGRVTFMPDRGGPWLVHGVYMRPAPAGIDADWESLWASLTFDVPAALGENRADK